MPRISEFFGISIYIYFEDHPPPHFHARYAEFEALIRIDDFRVLRGSLPPRALGLVVEWAGLRQEGHQGLAAGGNQADLVQDPTFG